MLHDVEKEHEEDLLDWVAFASDINESAVEDDPDGEWKTTRNSRKRQENQWKKVRSKKEEKRRCTQVQKRLGHVAVNCNSPLRCLACSGPHTKDECTAEPEQEKCANCHQSHIASSEECPAIRNAAAIQKLQRSGAGFEAAKHKVIKTQTELDTKAPFVNKQNLTVPIVNSNIMGSQHSIQENQQENQNDLTVQEVMVNIHQSGESNQCLNTAYNSLKPPTL
ncbi:hypothetical protein FHG87_022513 [Trinorchestia longiramus]|nr:hypothetical protein FHG87_022513 [Trinorchestia longiramus]